MTDPRTIETLPAPPDEAERDEVLAADPDPIGPCSECGAPRMDWSSECDCDDPDIAPTFEEDMRGFRAAVGRLG